MKETKEVQHKDPARIIINVHQISPRFWGQVKYREEGSDDQKIDNCPIFVYASGLTEARQKILTIFGLSNPNITDYYMYDSIQGKVGPYPLEFLDVIFETVDPSKSQ